MFAVPVMTSAAPAATAQELELEHAELLPARETLLACRFYPLYPRYSGCPVHVHPDPPVRE